MVITKDDEDTAITRRSLTVAMLNGIARPIDARTLAVPERKDACDLGLRQQWHLLRTPNRGGREIFIDARLEVDARGAQPIAFPPELHVKPAQGRPSVTADEACGIEACRRIATALLKQQPDQCLGTAEKHRATFTNVAVL